MQAGLASREIFQGLLEINIGKMLYSVLALAARLTVRSNVCTPWGIAAGMATLH